MITNENGASGQGSAALETLGRPPNNDASDGTATWQPYATQTSTMVEGPLDPLSFASLGWLVFPCRPGGKEPLTPNGFYDARADEQAIKAWLTRWPTANWAAPTGVDTVDTLDVDVRPGGDGRVALERLREAGLLDGAFGIVRTPSGGLHIYFRGTNQSCGRLPKHFIDFKSNGGYVLLPGSTVNGRRYEWIERRTTPGGRRLLWDSVKAILEPRGPQAVSNTVRKADGIAGLVRWVSNLRPGNRNAGLYWASCRALERGHRTDLHLLVEAAVQAGLSEMEARRTVFSAERRLAGAA